MTRANVEYSFTCDAAPEAAWLVQAVTLHEALSQPYTARVTLEGHCAKHLELLGASCRLSFQRGDGPARDLSGIIERAERSAVGPDQLQLVLTVGPAINALRHCADARVFTNMSVPEILAEVVDGTLRDFGRSSVLRLAQTYPKRDFCMQYNQTTWAWLVGLLYDEGINFFFEHPAGGPEKIIFCDDNGHFAPSAAGDAGQVEFAAPQSQHKEHVWAFARMSQSQSTSVAACDYDWTRPRKAITAEAKVAAATSLPLTRYGHQDAGLHDFDAQTYQADNAKQRTAAAVQAQALLAWAATGGASSLTALMPGTVLALIGHPEAACNQKWVVTAVHHEGAGQRKSTSDHKEESSYHNTFFCVPLDLTCRPTQMPESQGVPGVQTAVVVGPAGEEIWTDVHGRVKVRFPWDRRAEVNEAGYWVRVMQSWAGGAFGAMALPRVGMEVLVAFIDGHAQRPVVLGCTFNGANLPPCELPAQKTRTVLRTRSTPGQSAEAFNELTFEDAAGQEEIFMHAQRDMRIEVKNNHEAQIGGDVAITVAGQETSKIDGSSACQVGGDRTMAIGGDASDDIKGSLSTQVGKNLHTDVAADFRLLVEGNASSTINQNLAARVGKDVRLDVGGKAQASIKQNAMLQVEGNLGAEVGKKASLKAATIGIVADKTYTLEQDEAKITLKNGEVHITGKKIIINGQTITIKASGQLTTKGKSVSVN